MDSVRGVGEGHLAALRRPPDVVPVEMGEDHISDISGIDAHVLETGEKDSAGDVLLRDVTDTGVDQDDPGTSSDQIAAEVKGDPTIIADRVFWAVPLRIFITTDNIIQFFASSSVGD